MKSLDFLYLETSSSLDINHGIFLSSELNCIRTFNVKIQAFPEAKHSGLRCMIVFPVSDMLLSQRHKDIACQLRLGYNKFPRLQFPLQTQGCWRSLSTNEWILRRWRMRRTESVVMSCSDSV